MNGFLDIDIVKFFRGSFWKISNMHILCVILWLWDQDRCLDPKFNLINFIERICSDWDLKHSTIHSHQTFIYGFFGRLILERV